MKPLQTALAKFLIYAIGKLSLKSSRQLGRLLGWVAYKLGTRMAKNTQTNIALCLPHLDAPQRKKLALQSLQATGMLAAEVCGVFTEPEKMHRSILKVIGDDIAKEGLAAGKGLLILAPHLGNWEVLGWHLPTLAPVTNMYLPPKFQGLESLIINRRIKAGSVVVPANAKGVSAQLKALRRGEICGILPDQNPGDANSGDYAPFFGQSAFTMTLVYKLLQKTGAKAVFSYAKRVENGFEVIYRAAPEALYSADQSTSLAALNKGIESLALEAPEQYQWEYKRFKIQPNGGRSLYQ